MLTHLIYCKIAGLPKLSATWFAAPTAVMPWQRFSWLEWSLSSRLPQSDPLLSSGVAFLPTHRLLLPHSQTSAAHPTGPQTTQPPSLAFRMYPQSATPLSRSDTTLTALASRQAQPTAPAQAEPGPQTQAPLAPGARPSPTLQMLWTVTPARMSSRQPLASPLTASSSTRRTTSGCWTPPLEMLTRSTPPAAALARAQWRASSKPAQVRS